MGFDPVSLFIEGVVGIGIAVASGYETWSTGKHNEDVAAQNAQNEAWVAQQLQAQAKIDANNAVTDASLAAANAIANTAAQNAIIQEQATSAWNRQTAQAGIESQTLGMTLGGMEITEKSKESSMRASTAANGLTFSGSPTYRILAMQHAEAVAENYTETQGNAAIVGIQRDADAMLKAASDTELQNTIQAQQYADKQIQSAAEYSQDVLAKAALGVSEAAWQGQMQVSQAQWQGNQDIANAWLSGISSVINTETSLMNKYWNPGGSSGASTPTSYPQDTSNWSDTGGYGIYGY